MPAKRSGCAVSWPVLIIITIFASLLAAGLFLGIPYLQGRPEFPRGVYQRVVEGNQIRVEMDPDQEVLSDRPAGRGGHGDRRADHRPVAHGHAGHPPHVDAGAADIAARCAHRAPRPRPRRPQTGCVIFVSHTVQAGQTLFSISRQYVTSIPLMARHGISSTSLTTGAVLSVPVGDPACCSGGWRPYVVESGETWFGIAQTCGITLDTLLQGNGANSSTPLFMTQVICVP